MKLITILGARPQFIKAATVSRALIEYNRSVTDPAQRIDEKILHTGQHYDANMSDVFFRALEIPQPAWNLHCGGIGSHAEATARMMTGIERVLLDERPDRVLVYGDTDSTLAGALTAAKLHIPVAHVEAGLRSFNRRMPEEINRVLTDHLADRLFCPTHAAIDHLRREGITDGVMHTGDVMYDAALIFGRLAAGRSTVIESLGLTPKAFYLATVHRAENTDDVTRLTSIVRALIEASTPTCPVVWPLHPRTRSRLEAYGLLAPLSDAVRLTEPVDYWDMVRLEQSAAAILTDSGGIQKEAYFHRTPCVTLRDETEWTETVEAGWNSVVGCDPDRILHALHEPSPTRHEIADYGDGHAAEKIVEALF